VTLINKQAFTRELQYRQRVVWVIAREQGNVIDMHMQGVVSTKIAYRDGLKTPAILDWTTCFINS
jgi:hypothetical protein